MPKPIGIWDMQAEGGPVEIFLLPVTAREAMQRDPARYLEKLPPGKKPGPADVANKAAASTAAKAAEDAHAQYMREYAQGKHNAPRPPIADMGPRPVPAHRRKTVQDDLQPAKTWPGYNA